MVFSEQTSFCFKIATALLLVVALDVVALLCWFCLVALWFLSRCFGFRTKTVTKSLRSRTTTKQEKGRGRGPPPWQEKSIRIAIVVGCLDSCYFLVFVVVSLAFVVEDGICCCCCHMLCQSNKFLVVVLCVLVFVAELLFSLFLHAFRYSLRGPDLLESTRTLTARKPLNFGNSESLTRKLGKSDSETRKTTEFVFLSF